ncbi:hypothetical protein [Francisella philomiragia]|uniref:Uncharacterized protein n=1 Tax=Francisella philomiragia TaxID=28110 RepID=A0A0B6CV23_9GAMM|nr:hypothetical protein [Francisella philomiragia]AJI54349.1 hypothetical protein LA55_1255 [Francisella philomiragia]
MKSLKLILKPFKEYVINTKNYSKWSYHFFIPVFVCVIYITFHLQHISLDKIISSTQVFLPFITAFSFSALIALPSINNEKMEQVQEIVKRNGCKVQLEIRHRYKGAFKKTPLTNKMFLSIMLGYISFMSSLLFILSIILSNAEDTFFYSSNWWLEADSLHFISYYINILYYSICFFFIWGIASIITNLLYAIRIFTTSSCDIY